MTSALIRARNADLEGVRFRLPLELRPLALPGDPDAGALCIRAPEAAASGQVVVLCHGGGNDRLHGLWTVAERLAGAGHAVLAAHLAGHGRGGSDLFSLEAGRARLDALVALARAELGSRVTVLGQSLGGAFALDQAARGRGADALVSVSAPHRLEPSWRGLQEVAVLARPAAWSLLDHVGFWRALPAGGAFKRASFPVRVAPGQSYVAAFQQALDEMRLPERLAGVEAPPTLILHGTWDGVVPAEQARQLAQAMGPAAALRLLPQVLHMDPLLQPGVLDELLAWLSSPPLL